MRGLENAHAIAGDDAGNGKTKWIGTAVVGCSIGCSGAADGTAGGAREDACTYAGGETTPNAPVWLSIAFGLAAIRRKRSAVAPE